MKRIALALALLIGSTASAAPLNDCSRPLSVGYYLIPPYYYHGSDGQWQGIDRDVIEELGRRTGCRFEGQLESRVRTWILMRDGKLDIVTSGIPTPDRRAFARFILYLSERNLLVEHAPGGRVQPPSLENVDLLARTSGYRYGEDADAWITQLAAAGKVVDAADELAALRLVAIGRATAAITRGSAVALIRTDYPDTQLVITDPGWSSFHAGLVVSRARIGVALHARFVAALDAMRRDGTLVRIHARHAGAREAAHTSALPEQIDLP